MRGDLRELGIVRESVPDGIGGMVDGLAIRVWVDSDDDGDYLLAVTLLLPDGEHAWHPQARELIDDALRIWELER